MNASEMKSKAVKAVVGFVVVVILLAAGYLFVVLNWSFSKGDRIGFIQKFSQKGWVFKTWEGELQMLPVPGAIPEKFLFSVRDSGTVEKMNSLLGKKVAVTYEQHRGIPTTLFGESEYFVVGVKSVE